MVVDCANGAASAVAARGPARAWGPRCWPSPCEPDGSNINDGCGSTHPESLAAAVVEHGADLGLALDGDADRLLAVDHTGALATGDELLALFATDLAERGPAGRQHRGGHGHDQPRVPPGHGGARASPCSETQVGDRYVLEALDADGLTLGGEQSGHIVFRRLATTGDGVLTGLILADLVKRGRARRWPSCSTGSMHRLPQVLINVRRPRHRSCWPRPPPVLAAVAAVEAAAGRRGRVLLRASGTEPLVRVMVEAERRGGPQAVGAAAGPWWSRAAGAPRHGRLPLRHPRRRRPTPSQPDGDRRQ